MTVDNRKGAYPGMLEKRRFRITLFGTGTPEKSVAYDGKAVTVQF